MLQNHFDTDDSSTDDEKVITSKQIADLKEKVDDLENKCSDLLNENAALKLVLKLRNG